MKTYNILGIKVSYSNYSELVEKIIRQAKKGKSLKVAPVASHPIKNSFFDDELRLALKGFDLVLPDGQSLIWAARKLYGIDFKERTYGPELFSRVVRECEKQKLKILLYGNETTKLIRVVKGMFPKLVTVNLADLKGRRIGDSDALKLTKTAARYNRAILFIGIGSPAQHILMSKLGELPFPVVTVGAAFDFMAGTRKQAPDWVQEARLEWLFRLLSEPVRLWKRYLVDAPVFVLLVYLQKLKMIRIN